MKWAYDDIKTALKTVPRNLSVDVRIHISQTIISLPISDTNYHYKKKQNFASYPMISGPFTAVKEKAFTAVKEKSPASSAGGVQICMCRPRLLALVREEVEFAQGPVSVNGERYFDFLLPISPVNGLTYPVRGTASGPLSFTNDVRAICRADFAGPMAVLRGAHPITLYTEGFGDWEK